MKRGVLYAVGAYALWGLIPIYFKWLTHVSALELVAHRVVWSCLALAGVVLLSRQWRALAAAARNPRILRTYALAALLIAVNWLVFVWAVHAGFILQTSLGYFITPLVSVLLGVLILRERLRVWQWAAVGLAALGVLYLAFAYGRLPWVALTLGVSFACYGLVKKTAPLGSVQGLTLETAILLPPAMVYLLQLEASGAGAFLHAGARSDLLLVGAGLITAIPLLMFASATKRIPLSLIGLLQYIAPTLQFLLGALVYGEPFGRAQLVGFAIVWTALVLFSLEGWFARRAQPVIATE